MNNMEDLTNANESFSYGVIAVNPNQPDENGDLNILHFVGYWEEPNEDDIIELWEDLKDNEMFEMQEHIKDIELRPAPIEIVEYFNNAIESNLLDDN